MEIFERPLYLQKLIDRMGNGLIKIITGIRRSGKSVLLHDIFKNYLIKQGIKEDHIISLDLDVIDNEKYLDPLKLNDYVKSKIVDEQTHYVLLDEIQRVNNFESVLNGFLYQRNLDVYVTGSNSKFLSSDIITEFRGRSDEIRVLPLSFKEYLNASKKELLPAWDEYFRFGGMPGILAQKNEAQKSQFLINLFNLTYKKDILNRHKINKDAVLDILINILASDVGSLTNPLKLLKTFKSSGYKDVSITTINNYLDYLMDSFLIEKVERYDIKGRKYISTPFKYYFADVGLRNARLNFRQLEENHLMENIIYNELILRGYNVDIGVVEVRKETRIQYEVDFVCNQGSKRIYIQSALNLDTDEKIKQETNSLNNIYDNFKKIIIVKGYLSPYQNDKGILIVGILNFLLDDNVLNY